MKKKKTFLTAEWRKLVLANYQCDPTLLEKYLPAKTELDLWKDTCYVSLVGFKFCNTRVRSILVPGHTDFEEVNLRFYVKHRSATGEWKRGVVFIKEIVPKPAITYVANLLYKENYQTMPMAHRWERNGKLEVEYQWRYRKQWNLLKVTADNKSMPIRENSEEEFITQHFWGYTRLDGNTTSEYEVQHPKWEVYPVEEHHINVDFGSIYGTEFEYLKDESPLSVFLAEGSEIVVKEGGHL